MNGCTRPGARPSPPWPASAETAESQPPGQIASFKGQYGSFHVEEYAKTSLALEESTWKRVVTSPRADATMLWQGGI